MNARLLLPALGLSALLGSQARASSSSAGEEYLSTTEAVEPNIVFVIDLSSSMADPCPSSSDSDTADTGSSTSTSAFSDPCLDDVLDAIDLVTQHFDWARFGVVGTGDASSTTDTFFPIVPLGTSYAELSAALSGVSVHSTDNKNLGEVIAALGEDYFGNTDVDDGVDDDGDGFDNDWDEAPIEYWCQETHVIVFANQRPEGDENVGSISSTYTSDSGMADDVYCDSTDRRTSETSGDEQCYYDNAVMQAYQTDMRSDLTGDQNVVVHTIGLGIDSSSVGEELFGNATDEIGGAGIYASASNPDAILTNVLLAMQDIRSGTFSRSTPVVSADGNYLVYSFYSLNGDDATRSSSGMALGQGHIRAYEIDDDPTSATYGQVLYNGPTEYGGALWDGGDLLVSRLVTSTELNPEDRDGFGRRDIYTWFEPALGISALLSEAENDGRMGFDLTFVQEVAADSTVLDYVFDTDTDSSTGCATSAASVYDFSKDGCLVDEDDMQAMVDFVRGWNNAEFRYMAETRGRWRLGDSPHSVPVIVEARNNNFAIDPSYRTFLEELEANRDAGTSPDIVLLPANDGMLHAFALEDDTSTADTEDGEELWAWIPGYLLHREHDAEWAASLSDLMLYGRTFLFDGSPVVEDVWMDEDGDGVKDCTSVPSDCEWHRVVVVQQGKGGPVTLALDITDTDDPEFLWEQTDETGDTMGYTVGRPVIGNVYDATDASDPKDRWVVFWGSGRGVPYGSSTSTYYETAEANVYVWHVGDDYWGTVSPASEYQDSSSAGYARGDNEHPQSGSLASTLDSDGDGNYEYGYISAALAAVDVDSDGDVDTLYFPVSTSYSPTDEGGSGPGDVADPGSSWMYKACIDTSDPGDLTWIEFYDPVNDGALSARPEVFYAATTSWLTDGSLGVYWGTGTPYDRTGSDDGYFFAMKDTQPEACTTDSMQAISDCGTDGIFTFADAGEGMTSDPVVYAGVVYFSTWVPESDRCDGGTGRLYGLDYEDCGPGMDTDGDGDVDSDDDYFVEEEDAYISGVTVTDKGTLFYGSSNVTTDGSGGAVGTISAATDPFLGTATMAWMEMF